MDSMKEANRRVIIIGLDGGTWQILNPLMQEGKAPFFSSLAKRGARGILESSIPPVTAPAWTSFLTGKNPGKHGLFDFQRIDFETQQRKLTFSNDCKSASILDYLTAAGKRILLMNVPLTYPPQPINGLLISGFPVPPGSQFIYPPERESGIRELGYIVDWMEIYRSRKDLLKITMIKMADQAQLNVFASLLEQENWDVAMIVISGTDQIAHLEWQKGNVNEVKRYYAFIDGLLSDVDRKGLLSDATVVVMSDHGFSGGSFSFFMNTWLSSEGYMTYKGVKDDTYDVFLKGFRDTVYGDRKSTLSKLLRTIGLTRENLIYLGKKSGLIKLEGYLPHSVISVFPSHEASIDWSKTKAYMMSNASKGINVNLEGRDANGCVPATEYDKVRQEIVEKLRRVNGFDGQPIFQVADIKENVYWGPYVSQAPDIVTWPHPNYKIRIGTAQKHYLRRVTEAQHSLDGIYMLVGEEFIADEKARELSIMDIAPTLLHVMGLPVPEDMDGRVAVDLFSQASSSSQRAVTYRDPINKETDDFSAAEHINEDEVLEKLRALGYI
jgi:predicted AlkP superfamily phosphohydrolase/phosphomutase